jgi:inorganic pyrophosphatase
VKLEAVIETSKYGFVKRKADGGIDFVSPLPCPFNYGRIEGTESGDGDPLDAIVLGPRLPVGAHHTAEERGRVEFVDAGREDPKLILSDRPLSRSEALTIRAFFRAYVLLKRALNRARGRSGPTWVRSYQGL